MKKISYDIFNKAPEIRRWYECIFRDDLLQFTPPLFPVACKEMERADRKELRHVNLPDYCIQYLISGRFRVSWDGETKIMHPGDILWEPQGSELSMGNPEGCSSRRLFIELQGSLLHALAARLGLDRPALITPSDPERFYKLMLEIKEILKGDCQEHLPELMGKCVELVSLTAEQLGTFRQWLPDKVACGLKFIQMHLGNDISTGEVAAFLRLPPAVVNRSFKHYFGMTVNARIRHERMLLAAELLRATDLAVKAIAGKCGFRNERYFTDAFRKRWGCSPSDFRRREKNI